MAAIRGVSRHGPDTAVGEAGGGSTSIAPRGAQKLRVTLSPSVSGRMPGGAAKTQNQKAEGAESLLQEEVSQEAVPGGSSDAVSGDEKPETASGGWVGDNLPYYRTGPAGVSPTPKEPYPAATGAMGNCLVVCPTGGEASVIICLAALVALFPRQTQSPVRTSAGDQVDDGGLESCFGGGRYAVLRPGMGPVTKTEIRWRYILLQQECPWARPPRRLMQELNEYFMTPGEHSWWTLSDRLVSGDSCDPENK